MICWSAENNVSRLVGIDDGWHHLVLRALMFRGADATNTLLCVRNMHVFVYITGMDMLMEGRKMNNSDHPSVSNTEYLPQGRGGLVLELLVLVKGYSLEVGASNIHLSSYSPRLPDRMGRGEEETNLILQTQPRPSPVIARWAVAKSVATREFE